MFTLRYSFQWDRPTFVVGRSGVYDGNPWRVVGEGPACVDGAITACVRINSVSQVSLSSRPREIFIGGPPFF